LHLAQHRLRAQAKRIGRRERFRSIDSRRIAWNFEGPPAATLGRARV